MKNAVIYARYSRDTQTEQSIEGQMRVCKDYAMRNEILIVDTYVDRAMTGTNDNRAAFQQMLKDSDNKQWDYVLVYKLDRFSRNKYEMAIHRKHLSDNGVKILSAMENIPDTPEGVLMESLLEGMNEYYSKELSQKVRRGLHESRSKGYFIGGNVNYGYKLEPVMREENGKQVRIADRVVINEYEAPIVNEVFTSYANGVSIAQITRNLNDRGLQARGRPFNQNQVRNLLHHEKYTGIYRVNDMVYDKIFPRIVQPEIYEIVRKKLVSNKTGNRYPDKAYYLTGYVYCKKCGKRLNSVAGTSKNGKVFRYYRCPHCFTRTNKENLELLVHHALCQVICTEEKRKSLAHNCYEIYTTNNKQHDEKLVLTKELAQTEKAIANLIKALEAGIFSDTTKARLDELENRKTLLELQLQNAKLQDKNALTEKKILQYINQAKNLNTKLLIPLLVKNIFVTKERVDIELNYTQFDKEADAKNRKPYTQNKCDPDGIDNPDRGFCYLEIPATALISYNILHSMHKNPRNRLMAITVRIYIK